MNFLPEQFGFRNGERGTHTSRTIMLAELRILLDAHPATATKSDYWDSIIADNLLGKKTGSTRRLNAQRLSELYGLAPEITLFRLLRFFWALDESGRPLLAFLCAMARDPLLRLTAPPVLATDQGVIVPTQDIEAAIVKAAPHRFNPSPLPARPGTAHITELLSLTGNAQLVAVYNQRERLAQDAATWKKTADEIAKRLPQWQTLQELLRYCNDLPGTVEVRTQAHAIAAQRALLNDPDPVPGLCDHLTQLLREALVKHHGEYSALSTTQMDALRASAEWNRLSPTQQQAILDENGLSAIPSIKVGTEAEVLASLTSISLTSWETRIDALPQRFVKAQLAAARLLEPQAVHVTLPSMALKTAEDVEAWLAEVRQKILVQLKRGPVVI